MNDNLIPVDQALYESLKWFMQTNSCSGPATDAAHKSALEAIARYMDRGNSNLIPGLERAFKILVDVSHTQGLRIERDAISLCMRGVLKEIEREKAKIPLRNDKPESFAHTLMYCQKCGEFRGHGHEEICKSKDSESGTAWGTLANKGPV